MKKKIKENYVKIILFVLGLIFLVGGIVFNNSVTISVQKSEESQITSIKTSESRSTANMQTGKVIVKYVDTTGKEIKTADEYVDYLGEEYNIERKDISGYTAYGVDPINKTGNYSSNDIVVTFVYQNAGNIVNVNNEDKKITIQILNEKKLSKYNFKIITKSTDGKILTNTGYKITDQTGKVIKEDVSQGQSFVIGTLTVGEVGTDTYNIKQTKFPENFISVIDKDISIKMIKTLNDSTNLYQIDIQYDDIQGLKAYVENGEIIVEIQNKEVEFGKIIKKYQDVNGNQIENDENIKDEVGKEYALEEKGKDIKGYTFKEVKGNIKGKYTKEDIIVTYIYEKDINYGNVIKKYQDTEGKEIEKQVVQTGVIGEEYTLEEKGKDIKGYTFKEIKGNIKGTYKTEDITVIYVYTKNKVKEDKKDEEKAKFDLEIEKKVKKVIVKDNKSTTTKKAPKKDGILKIEIPAKQIKNTSLEVEYEITVKNVGEVAGYAKKIVDYLPNDFKYITENKNSKWKVNGKEITIDELSNKLIKPGESQNITVNCESKLSESNLGAKTNTAKISLYYNEDNLKDSENNNDTGKATIIIGVKTGAVAYTLEIIGLILILTAIAIVLVKLKNKNK